MKKAESFSFVPGNLTINVDGYGEADGSGRISFGEDDLHWDGAGRQTSAFVPLARSELLALRDFLKRVLPEDKASLNLLLDWCLPRLKSDGYVRALIRYRKEGVAPDHTAVVQSDQPVL